MGLSKERVGGTVSFPLPDITGVSPIASRLLSDQEVLDWTSSHIGASSVLVTCPAGHKMKILLPTTLDPVFERLVYADINSVILRSSHGVVLTAVREYFRRSVENGTLELVWDHTFVHPYTQAVCGRWNYRMSRAANERVDLIAVREAAERKEAK